MPRLPRAARRGEAEGEPAPVLREPDGLDDTLVRQLEPPDVRQRLRVVEVESRVAVDVRVHDERASLRDRRRSRDPSRPPARTPSSGSRCRSGRSRRRLCPSRSRRGTRSRSLPQAGSPKKASCSSGATRNDRVALEVDEMQVVVARALGEPEHAEPAAVRREPCDLAVAAGREHASLGACLERADEDVEVASVATVARVGEPGAVGGEPRRDVQELRLDDERLERRAGLRVGQVELRPLVAAGVHRGEDPTAAGDEATVDRLLQARQLDRLGPSRARRGRAGSSRARSSARAPSRPRGRRPAAPS